MASSYYIQNFELSMTSYFQFYLAVDAELSKVGLTVEKFRLKRKGELEEDFVVLQNDPFREKLSRDEF